MVSEKKNITNNLLKCGVAAGPLYVVVGAIEILTRPGFDMRKHSLSLMSLGSLGWIHITLFIVTGLLVILGAIGIRRAIKGEKALRQSFDKAQDKGSGQAGTWAPIMLALYGLSLIGAGLSIPDPMKGFPPGTPMDLHTFTTHGLLHLLFGAIGFAGLIAACLIFGKRFKHLKDTQQGMFSVITGFVFLFAFIGIAGFSQMSDSVVMFVTLFFYFAVFLSWTWLSTICARLIE